MTGVRVSVDTGAVRAAADAVGEVACGLRALLDHPGLLEGRAADAGDDDLRAALVDLGRRWDHGWGVLAAESAHWADLLAGAADVYDTVEGSVARSPWAGSR
ncbi:hypothetical protein GCM10027446_32530 [Angustibacter peucedani]